MEIKEIVKCIEELEKAQENIVALRKEMTKKCCEYMQENKMAKTRIAFAVGTTPATTIKGLWSLQNAKNFLDLLKTSYPTVKKHPGRNPD